MTAMGIEKTDRSEQPKSMSSDHESLSRIDEKSAQSKLWPVVDKIISMINPKNRWVPDYTDKSGFAAAYKEARKNFNKEFMRKNERYSTKNTASQMQQLSIYGNTDSLLNLPVSDYTKGKIKDEAEYGRKIDKEKLDRLIEVNTLAGNPSYLPVLASPIAIAVAYSEKEAEENNLTPIEKIARKAKKLQEIRTDTSYIERRKEDSKKRSMFFPLINKIRGSSYTAEEAHGYRNAQEGSELLAFIKNRIKNPFVSEKWQDNGYKNPEHFEFDTHQNVEPVLQSYIDGYIGSEEIKSLIDQMRKISKDDKMMFAPKKNTIRSLQIRLKADGYVLPHSTREDGTMEGVWNEETKQALQDWQKKYVEKSSEKKTSANTAKVGEVYRDQK